jgi:RNA polymerase sigma-70 factor (ECF subfamily)
VIAARSNTNVSTSSLNLQQLDARDPDARLMLQVRDDVPAAFEVLVERYQHRLLCILLHVVGDAEAAEDLTQDVFLRVYRSRKSYTPRAKFSTWLFTIAHNLAMNHLRGRGRNRAVPLQLPQSTESSSTRPAHNPASAEPTASAQMRSVELAEVVRAALDELGEDQKMAVLLNKFEDLGYAEIAEVMGRSEAAIKSLLARARYNLKERLEPYLRTGRRHD